MNLILKNARIIDPGRNIDTIGDIGIENGVIADPGKVKDAKVIDLTGKVLTPGESISYRVVIEFEKC